jgi:GntR family transcriptional regulator/MocR family aminotransferase
MRAAIALDAGSSVPLHRQIYDAWRVGILAGRFRPGDRLPSTRELAVTLEVARSTVSQAYEQLLAEGYLQATRGAGTFVCRELPEALSRPPVAVTREAKRPPALRLSALAERLRDDFRMPAQPRGFICFSRWGPDLERFPLALWRKLVTRAMRTATPDTLDYAAQSRGLDSLRREIAAYVARSRAVHCSYEQVVIVNGSQQALDLCARLLAEPGDEVGFENPGYLGTRRIFQAQGLRLRPARIDGEGMVPGDLRGNVRLVYVTPSHQFPTGVAMSLARRLELLAWARRHRAVIVEDDYDSEYRYNGPALPSLQGLASDVPVVYCGTFSKVMFPGLRIGYAVLPTQLVDIFARAKWLVDRQTPVLDQMALTAFLSEGHLERHIRRMRRLYGDRRQALVAAVATHFGDSARVSGDPAGMHVLVRFDDPGIAERATANKVLLLKTSDYYLARPPQNEFILGFSGLGEKAIREGIARLSSEQPSVVGKQAYRQVKPGSVVK